MSYGTQSLHPKNSGATRDRHDFFCPAGMSHPACVGAAGEAEIFRLLINHEPGGIVASSIAHTIGSPQNTICHNLTVLTQDLIHGPRKGCSDVYRADLAGIQSLKHTELESCCHDDEVRHYFRGAWTRAIARTLRRMPGRNLDWLIFQQRIRSE